jgi:Flp pilus assembly protein TadD
MMGSKIYSLEGAGACSCILRVTSLLVMAIYLSGCATAQSRGVRTEPEEPLIYDQYEGMSAEEITAAGDEAWREGELEQAVFIYMQSLAIADDPDVWMKVGKIQQHGGQIQSAWKAYSRVIELDSQSAEGYERMGILLLSSKQKDLAAQHLRKSIELDNHRWLANNALGVLADAAGEYELAIGYYEKALERYPNSPMLLTNMGYSYYLSGQFEEAERLFSIAIGIDRSYTAAKKNLGLVRARSGRYESAVNILMNVIEKPKALNDVGYIALANGDIEEAERLLKEAIRLSPAYYETAYENLERVKQARDEIRPRAEEVKTYVGSPATDIEQATKIHYRLATTDPTPVETVAISKAGWTVQLGSFSSRKNAQQLADKVGADGLPVFLMTIDRSGKKLYRVRVGPWESRAKASEVAERLKKAGYAGQVTQ